jgi:glycosyltransferase involved in cell wall biosynthesis
LKTIKKNKKGICDVVFMAQLRPSKGIFDLIKIWRLICQQKPELKLGIIGRGKKEIVEAMEQKVLDSSLKKKISFLGYLPDDRAYSVIKSAKIFITPSFEEGFGITMLEAQFLGRPVVAWHLPVFDEIFEKGMIKVKIGDIEKFAREVVRLLEDNNFYQKLSKEAIVNATRFDWNKTAQREKELFLSL